MQKIIINGNLTPVVGVEELYSVIQLQDSVLPSSALSQNKQSNAFDKEIKWFIYVLDRGSWRLTQGNEKTGATVDFTFTQNSLKWKEMRMIVHAYGQKAMIAITPQKASQGKILDVQLLDANYSKPTKPFAYNDWIVARVYCIDMELQMLKVTLWEDDGDKTKQNTGNIKIEVKEAAIKNGTADVKFFLNPSHAWLANARLAPGDNNEGEFHEYYVTAEIFEKVSKRVHSKNANVPNSDYTEPLRKPIPAEQKGPSKKDEKGIAKSEKKVLDYHEEKVTVKNEISTNPIMEKINSLMTVNIDDKWWEKKEEKKKDETECYCYKQGIVDISCNSKGSLVTNDHFENLSKDIGVEANVFKAVAIVESGGRKSFVNLNGKQKAKILYERHYMYRFLKKLKTEDELNTLKQKYPNLVHNIGTYKDTNAKYGSEVEQFDKLEQSKEIDNDYAIQSCSWGKFQVMGKYYDYLYKSPNELEEAMNMCEIQHFAYFKIYLKDVTGADMIKAMKEKKWNRIAELYNGTDYAVNKYHTKMKDEYEKL